MTLNIHIQPSVHKEFSVYTPDEDLRQIEKLSVAGFQSVMAEKIPYWCSDSDNCFFFNELCVWFLKKKERKR